MSASAKPTEKLFKSFLAVVLAISLCPLMPVEKAQAEEAGDLSEPTDAAQVADEGESEDADPTESALAASNSDANLELAEESSDVAGEGATDDGNAALQAASDSKTPIVDWTKCGTCQWMIDASGCLIIEPQSGETGELEAWDWTAPWCNYKNSIISATIKKTVIAKTTQKAFYDCKSLRSIDLSGLDASHVAGMSSMFEGCSSLASLDLSSFDTSKVTSMYCMFQGCSSLSSLDLSSFDTSKVAQMRGMFSGCSSLVSLDLSSFDTSKVTNMSFMFEGCLRLETLNLSSFNAGNVVDMSFMFEDCQSLKTISFPAVLDTPRVTNFSSMFSGCRSLEGLDVSGFDTSAAKSLGSMFYGCKKLASLDVSNFDTSAATSLSSMFGGCESLRSLDLSGFDTSAADYQYGLSWFLDGCKSLRTVTLGPKFAFEGAGLDRQCSLPTPKDNGLSGRWISSKDGIAYTPSGVPSNVAATYTAQETGDTRAWNQNGTCIWSIDEDGRLTVKPITPESGELYSSCPWRDEKSRIKTVYFEKGVIAPKEHGLHVLRL